MGKPKVTEEILEAIRRIEGCKELTKFPKMHKAFYTEEGKTVIVIVSESTSQEDKNGNCAEITNSLSFWNHICKYPSGSFYVVYRVDKKYTYYRTDLLNVIIGWKQNETPSEDESRHFFRILVQDAIEGNDVLRAMGSNNTKSVLFTLDAVKNVNSVARDVPGYVYLTSDNTGYTKIGTSNNPIKREKGLKTSNPFISIKKQLRFDTEKEALEKETELHARYKKMGKHVGGEFFNLTSDDLVSLLYEYDWRSPFAV